MSQSACVRMPFLHPSLSGALCRRRLPDRRGLFYCSPGISHGDNPEENYWRADNYFFDQPAADRLLAEIRAMDTRDVLREKFMLENCGNGADIADELAAISSFARDGDNEPPSLKPEIVREIAQKILLWTWFQEELVLEIARLTLRGLVAEKILSQSFQDKEQPAEDMDYGDIFPDAAILSNWKNCMLGAAVFLPPEMPIVADGPMAADLMENLDFEYEPELALSLGFSRQDAENVLAVRAPLWRAFGARSQLRNSSDILREIHNASRLWIVGNGL